MSDPDFLQEFLCPISRERIDVAVIARDQFTYDKDSLDHWFKDSTRSPMLGTMLASTNTFHNKAVQFLVDTCEGSIMRRSHLACLKADPKMFVLRRVPAELQPRIESLMQRYFRLSSPLSELYAEFEELIRKYPDVYQLYLEYANMRRFGMDTDKATALIEAAAKVNPNTSITKYMSARVSSVEGDFIRGRAMVDELHQSYSILDHTLLEMRYLASAYTGTRSKKLSLDIVSAYVDICPNDARARLNQIFTYYTMQEDNNVISFSEKFLARYEYDACVVYYRARSLVKKGDKAQAQKLYELIVSRSKEPLFLAQCYYDMAFLKTPETEFEAMERDLKKSHELCQKLNADLQLAGLYRNRNNFVEAERWTELYGAHVKKETDIYYNRLMSDIYASTGRKDSAVQILFRLADIDAENSVYYNNRADELLN